MAGVRRPGVGIRAAQSLLLGVLLVACCTPNEAAIDPGNRDALDLLAADLGLPFNASGQVPDACDPANTNWSRTSSCGPLITCNGLGQVVWICSDGFTGGHALSSSNMTNLLATPYLNTMQSLENITIINNPGLRGTMASNFVYGYSSLVIVLRGNNFTTIDARQPGSCRYVALDLSYNQLDGEVPTWILDMASTCRSATDINLSHNVLKTFSKSDYSVEMGSLIPIPAASGFQRIDISYNQFTGLMPIFRSSIPSPDYTVLRANNNQFSGPIPDMFTRQTPGSSQFITESGFMFSFFDHNLFDALPSAVPRAAIEFHASYNRISTILPSFWATSAPALLVLDLSHNQITSALPDFTTVTSSDTREVVFSSYLESTNAANGGFDLCHKITGANLDVAVILLNDNQISGPFPLDFAWAKVASVLLATPPPFNLVLRLENNQMTCEAPIISGGKLSLDVGDPTVDLFPEFAYLSNNSFWCPSPAYGDKTQTAGDAPYGIYGVLHDGSPAMSPHIGSPVPIASSACVVLQISIATSTFTGGCYNASIAGIAVTISNLVRPIDACSVICSFIHPSGNYSSSGVPTGSTVACPRPAGIPTGVPFTFQLADRYGRGISATIANVRFETIDLCGVCNGANACVGCDGVANSGRVLDCNMTCGGSATVDTCGRCSTSSAPATPIDCHGTCNGNATFDSCGICSGGSTGRAANSTRDCYGTCNGTAALDACGICAGGNTNRTANVSTDCYGTCNGTASRDGCGICTGGYSNRTADATRDCYGTCNGTAMIDYCGTCVLGQTGKWVGFLADCNGTCFGLARIDSCAVCSGGTSGHVANSDKDCRGICFGHSDCSIPVPGPTITAVTPDVSPLLGSVHTITGTNFRQGILGWVDGYNFTLIWRSPNELLINAPPIPEEGYKDVYLENPDGSSVTAERAMFYTDDCPFPGYYGRGADCRPCPEGAYCPGGYRVWPLPGYWNPGESTPWVIPCAPPNDTAAARCLGGQTSQCGPGYSGEFCSGCESGFIAEAVNKPTSSRCVSCEARKSMLPELALSAALFFGLFFLAVIICEDESLSAVVSILTTIQLVCVQVSSANYNLPSWLHTFFSWMMLLTLDLKYLSPDCYSSGGFGFVSYFWGTMLVPMIGGVMCLVGLFVLRKVRSRLDNFYYDRTVRAVIIVIQICYINMGTRAMQAVYCERDPGGFLRLHIEPTMQCFQGPHILIFVMAVLILIFYSGGYPVLGALWIKRNKRRLVNERLLARYGYLYEEFKAKDFYFAGVSLLVSLTLSASTAFGNTVAFVQFSVSTIALLFYLLFIAIRRPYSKAWKNLFSVSIVSVAIFTTVLNYVTVLPSIHQSQVTISLVSYFMGSVVALVVVGGVLVIVVFALRFFLKRRADKEVEEFSDGADGDYSYYTEEGSHHSDLHEFAKSEQGLELEKLANGETSPPVSPPPTTPPNNKSFGAMSANNPLSEEDSPRSTSGLLRPRGSRRRLSLNSGSNNASFKRAPDGSPMPVLDTEWIDEDPLPQTPRPPLETWADAPAVPGSMLGVTNVSATMSTVSATTLAPSNSRVSLAASTTRTSATSLLSVSGLSASLPTGPPLTLDAPAVSARRPNPIAKNDSRKGLLE